MTLLSVDGLHAAYGSAKILFGVSFDLAEGEVLPLLGRNGMGKTTTVRAILGLTPPSAGAVRFAGEDVTGAPAHAIARRGIGLVPEGRKIFPTLTVEENLVATSRTPKGARWTLPEVYRFFPRLGERREQLGSLLSGGEQQMLAIGRALMTNPRLLILDEATEGLAPLIRAEIWERLTALKDEGAAIIVIDKNLDALKRLADRHVILAKGEVVWTGTSAELENDAAIVDRYLHV